jgi:transcriptional regulator with XRE-family HTH domain
MSDFSEWIAEQINERGWKKSELAKRSGLDRSYTYQIIAGNKRPGAVACRAIARALDVPEVIVFRQISYLTEDPVLDPSIENFIAILSQLSNDDQAELLEIAKLKLDRQNRLKNVNN